MRAWLHGWLARSWESPPAPAPRGTGLLDAAEALYRAGLRLRRIRPVSAPMPVVSIGSLLVGGAGKTPLAAALARLACEEGLRPALLLRGYDGRARGGVLKVPPRIGPGEVALHGDEACQHARRGDAAVFVSARRIRAAEEAAREGRMIALLDDGMQHRAIARDWEIVSLPAERPFGNGRLLPRGPLREAETELARADLIVLSHARAAVPPPETLAVVRRHAPRTSILSWKAEISLRALSGEPPASGSTVALLSGIGRPETFRIAIAGLGYRVAWIEAYPDHHRFRQQEIDDVRRRAGCDGIDCIITTEKDEMRLLGLDIGQSPGFCSADLRLAWSDPGAEARLRASLRRLVADRRGG